MQVVIHAGCRHITGWNLCYIYNRMCKIHYHVVNSRLTSLSVTICGDDSMNFLNRVRPMVARQVQLDIYIHDDQDMLFRTLQPCTVLN